MDPALFFVCGAGAGGYRNTRRTEIEQYVDYPGAHKCSFPINRSRDRRDYRAVQELYADLSEWIATPPPASKNKLLTIACVQGANRPRIGKKFRSTGTHRHAWQPFGLIDSPLAWKPIQSYRFSGWSARIAPPSAGSGLAFLCLLGLLLSAPGKVHVLLGYLQNLRGAAPPRSATTGAQWPTRLGVIFS